MRAVLFRLLRHQPDIRHRAHRAGVKGSVLPAKVDDGLVNARVTAVGDDGEGILEFALGIPHLARGADHGRHRSVDNDIAGDVEVGNAFVGVDHGECRTAGERGFDICLDGSLLVGGKILDLGDQIAEAVTKVDAKLADQVGMFRDEILEEDIHGVSENDRIGNLHHRGLHVQGEEHPSLPGFRHLLFKELEKGLFAHDGRVEHFAGLEGRLFLEHSDFAIRSDEFDLHRGGLGHGDGLLVGEEVVLAHRGHVGFGLTGPRAHGMRVVAGVLLDGLGSTPIGVAFTEDRVHRTALDLVITCLGLLFFVVLRLFGIVRELVALALQLGDGGFELRHGGADVGQFDDVRFRFGGEGTQFAESIADLLVGGEILGETRQDTSGERNVPGLDRDAGMFGEGLDDWKK